MKIHTSDMAVEKYSKAMPDEPCSYMLVSVNGDSMEISIFKPKVSEGKFCVSVENLNGNESHGIILELSRKIGTYRTPKNINDELTKSGFKLVA